MSLEIGINGPTVGAGAAEYAAGAATIAAPLYAGAEATATPLLYAGAEATATPLYAGAEAIP